ncbi:MAG: conjugal transfer protein TraL [Nitrospira sp. HN-bin3]|uniref:conjugal transfer protein TraL n=1 Tax=Nitrospira cf. moscoviensis SBR1015 TaxID=96242 RepID=UPI000A0DB0C0|nr:conjugal transfer protein TraL [Nitrospira cf. moscoviensis SBR1015]MBX3328435.1 conjugal transfer protein TraL [Nitrospira sp.]OQW47569.1 MAG: conjugal transfer protein TraL [Nitrospira sp. HN-bin3]
MALIHLVLQGKGGVGKSMIASFIAQYKLSKGKLPLCLDTDPVNASFEAYKSLKVQHLTIMQGDEIDPRSFDHLIELVARTKVDVVIDNGASTFVPLSAYLLTNHIPNLLRDMSHQLVVHTVVTGGQASSDTINGFAQLVKQFPADVQFIVWLNPYWGPIELKGKTFEEMKAYLENKDRVAAIIRLPDLKKETFGRDLSNMLQNHLTFDEAVASPAIMIMERQRLSIIKKQLFEQFSAVPVL